MLRRAEDAVKGCRGFSIRCGTPAGMNIAVPAVPRIKSPPTVNSAEPSIT